MEARSPITDYRVEVSGWDVDESFFVEKATLEVNQLSECVIYLRHPLRAGLMVFLRLIDSRVRYPTFPVAYRVTEVTSAEGAERSRVILQKLRRRRVSHSEARDTRGATKLF
jgi:hypothetical protein